MKRKFAAVLILIVGFSFGVIAQSSGLWTGAAVNTPIAATITSATCSAVLAGVTNICYTGTGAQISCNGALYIPGDTCTPAAAGVSSISINGSQAKTGAVTFTITDTPAVTVAAPTITASAAAPTATAKSTITAQ